MTSSDMNSLTHEIGSQFFDRLLKIMTYVLLDFPNEILSFICLYMKEDKPTLIRLASTCKHFHSLIGTSKILWSDIFIDATAHNYLTELATSYERAHGHDIKDRKTVFTWLCRLSKLPLLRYASKRWLLPDWNERTWNMILREVLLMDRPCNETFTLVLMKNSINFMSDVHTIDLYIDKVMVPECNIDALMSQFTNLMWLALRYQNGGYTLSLCNLLDDMTTIAMANHNTSEDFVEMAQLLRAQDMIELTSKTDFLEFCICMGDRNKNFKKVTIIQRFRVMLGH